MHVTILSWSWVAPLSKHFAALIYMDRIYMDRRKKAAKKAVDKARNDMEADLYTKLDEDAGKKIIKIQNG